MTHPGVGPIVSLVYVLTLGDWRGSRGKPGTGQLPGSDSGRRLERPQAAPGAHHQAGQHAGAVAAGPGRDPGPAARSSWHRQYLRLSMNRHHGVAKVAIAHKLAVRMYWMLRSGQNYKQVMERGSHAGQSV